MLLCELWEPSAALVTLRVCLLQRWCHAGKLCIEVSSASKLAWISEELCIGCGICVKVCQ
jgi:translation initiation factor RLI1